MHTENLVRMANQIGTFFEAMPDRAVALEEMAQHIRKFWEPRMRKQLLEHVDRSGDGLNQMASEALARHRGQLL
ncbi:formate dehydrogenase subunit delta [Variovorax dokdonensis]|uniref:Formate dehydrogenase subunit delta n=1 Tax=Variovorax dokdonensis TaxID=344883 RepID=A0ABT7N517_9BURK|nr:formate dehydrogenase subunit delta [Variovorax dokdonensis]MDM0043032.1 formate dehydrogenase subunit delta [Variovorax dokdonensis]